MDESYKLKSLPHVGQATPISFNAFSLGERLIDGRPTKGPPSFP